MMKSTLGIILAAGDGTRMKSKSANKTALLFNNKPMIAYGVETLEDLVDKVVVVVGAYAESIKSALKNNHVLFVDQKERLGTGHAVQIALKALNQLALNPQFVLVGYGDHMMFIKPSVVEKLIFEHQTETAKVTLLTTSHDDPNMLAWGRIIRDSNGYVTQIIEQKDANENQRQITEINPGFYCFDYHFLFNAINNLKPSKATGEYYLTDMIELAQKSNQKVCACKVPFEDVGIGVNTPQQLQLSQELFLKYKHKAY